MIDTACVLADLAYTVLSDTCTPVEGPEAPIWLNVLSHISLVITSLFLVEIPLSIWALGTKFYNPFGGEVPHAALHLFDAFVILTTFILEVVLRGRERELVSLLIILRLWRLVKLVGGTPHYLEVTRSYLSLPSIRDCRGRRGSGRGECKSIDGNQTRTRRDNTTTHLCSRRSSTTSRENYMARI